MRRVILCAFLLLAGCVRRPLEPSPPLPLLTGPLRVAVVPFRTTIEPPLPGLGAAAARALGDQLAGAGFSVVDADRVADAAQAEAGSFDTGFARRVADKVGATLAVLGAISRYREREGPAWAAASPASVAYEVALVRASDGRLLVFDRFEHTQQAGSDSTLELPAEVRGGVHWLSRDEMLDQALRRTADRLARGVLTAPPAAP